MAENTVTWTKDDSIEQGLVSRFKAADLDGNGLIDREEFGHLAETTGTDPTSGERSGRCTCFLHGHPTSGEPSGSHTECSAGAGTECAVFHWLATSTIDELFDKYAEDEAITFEAFKRLVRLTPRGFL